MIADLQTLRAERTGDATAGVWESVYLDGLESTLGGLSSFAFPHIGQYELSEVSHGYVRRVEESLDGTLPYESLLASHTQIFHQIEDVRTTGWLMGVIQHVFNISNCDGCELVGLLRHDLSSDQSEPAR